MDNGDINYHISQHNATVIFPCLSNQNNSRFGYTNRQQTRLRPQNSPKQTPNQSTKNQSPTNQPPPKERTATTNHQTQPTKPTHKQKSAKPRQEHTQETKQAHLTRNHPNQKLLQPNNFTPNSPQLKKTTHTQLKNWPIKILGKKNFFATFCAKTAKFANHNQNLKKVLQMLEGVSKKSTIASNGDFRRYF
jgi:hypothetical protein